MSNEFAVAAVTLTLRNLLDKIKDIQDSDEFNLLPADAKPTAEILVTNLPLDEAHEFDAAKNQVNLFLYHVEHSPGWRNMDLPGRIKPGETGHPPLALNLYYVITAYGENGSELIGHLLLGKAMSLLHDHAVFGRDEIKAAFEISGLHDQIERVRITPQPISLDEISKLWTGFQTQYRLSAAYQVAVVLIESKRPAKTPLPVLTRGEDDQGVASQPNLLPPYPALSSVTPPNNQPGAKIGDVLILTGHHLQGDSMVLRFKTPRLAEPIERPPLAGGTDIQATVGLPDDPANWPVGFYTLEAVISNAGEPDRTTNKIPLMIVPSITSTAITPLNPPVESAYTATVTCSPQIKPEQHTALLLGGREFEAENHPAQTDTLTFRLAEIADGEYPVRLRIDGVDSLLVDRSVEPPVFDPSQKVTIP
ncbi:MAG: DUF4255 domain-containing protein [Desulfobacteraceae bacterium]|nr:DUF4255 domain-containing protein [Desulfobacteraceae bacterium]